MVVPNELLLRSTYEAKLYQWSHGREHFLIPFDKFANIIESSAKTPQDSLEFKMVLVMEIGTRDVLRAARRAVDRFLTSALKSDPGRFEEDYGRHHYSGERAAALSYGFIRFYEQTVSRATVELLTDDPGRTALLLSFYDRPRPQHMLRNLVRQTPELRLSVPLEEIRELKGRVNDFSILTHSRSFEFRS